MATDHLKVLTDQFRETNGRNPGRDETRELLERASALHQADRDARANVVQRKMDEHKTRTGRDYMTRAEAHAAGIDETPEQQAYRLMRG